MIELACVVTVVALAIVSELRQGRSDARSQVERAQWSKEREAREDRFQAERDKYASQLESILSGHRQEIAALCQRIQAPEYAVVEHAQSQASPSPPAANPMLDEDYWEAIDKIGELEAQGFDVTPLVT